MRRIVGGAIESRSIECRKCFMRLKSTLISPRLFVSGISALTTDEKIRDAFAPFGNLVEAKVMRDTQHGRSMRSAFVTYDTIEEAEKALNGMKHRRLDGYRVFVEPREFDVPVQEHVLRKTEWIVYLDLDDLDESEGVLDLSTSDKLRAAFAPFGNVLDARIHRDVINGNLKRRATVSYGSKEEAAKAQDALDDNRLRHPTVVPAEPKELKPYEQQKTDSGSSYIASGYTKSEHYHTEAGGENMNRDEVEKQIIRKGDIISLNELLFTRNRDYLIRNDKEHVKAQQLENKVIGIYFLPLYVECPQYSKFYTSLLKDLYDDLQPFHNFEVVLVAVTDLRTTFKRELPHPSLTKDPQEHFEDLFSCMPWTAIPFSDVASRESMQRSFGVQEEYPTIFVVESTGMVLQSDTWHIFQDFGALGYPFSDERINFMRAEDDAAANQPSLKILLASPKRNYVITSKGDEVPIHTFEDKVVALYFYHVDVANNSLTETLKFAYEELAKINKKFEVVLVYITESRLYGRRSYCKESFCKEFETMPWLALPYRDECCKKLRRVFKISDNGIDDPNKLVIIGPHAEFIEPFGASILLQYGIPAYPFTFKKAVELEVEKIKELKLEMLWDMKTVFRRCTGLQVNFSDLFGKKRVMLVFERFGVEHDFHQNSPNNKFLLLLIGRYHQTKGTDDEFEVIRIVINGGELDLGDKCCLVSLQRNLAHADWIVSLASQLKQNVGSYIWYGRPIDEFEFFLPIVAFDQDGRLVRKTMYPTFENMKFPFYAGGLEEELSSELTALLR